MFLRQFDPPQITFYLILIHFRARKSSHIPFNPLHIKVDRNSSLQYEFRTQFLTVKVANVQKLFFGPFSNQLFFEKFSEIE